MAVEGPVKRILQLYPPDCHADAISTFQSPYSFSGARLWRVAAPRGPLCLRRWPAEHPTAETLQFIQAVLWHVDQEGFRQVPLPLETNHRHGFVRHDGHLWELAPWLPGTADYRSAPSPARLVNAMLALAEFHQRAGSFPLAETGPIPSPGMSERAERLARWVNGGLRQLRAALAPADWPELAARGHRVIALAEELGRKFMPILEAVSRLDVAIQPCIRDVWHAHVLFVGDDVSGIVDFGAMRPENVAADVARLLASLAGDNAVEWQRGLSAYETIRPLSHDERTLAAAFDRTTVLMAPLQWLEWIYVDGRQFANRAAVLQRVDEFLGRLEALAQGVG